MAIVKTPFFESKMMFELSSSVKLSFTPSIVNSAFSNPPSMS